MSFTLPPIAKTAERLLLEIEKAVAGFPRKHRYTAGEELRTQAMDVTVLVHRAWRDRQNQVALIERLRWDVDALKIRMQLCSRLHLFASLAQFEMLARQANISNFNVVSFGKYRSFRHAERLHREEAAARFTLRAIDRDRQCEGRMALPLRLRDREGSSHPSVDHGRHDFVRLLPARAVGEASETRHDLHADLPAMGVHDGSLLPAECPQLPVLRREGDHGLRALARLPELPCGYGRPAGGAHAGPGRQLEGVQSRKLPLVAAQGAESEHPKQPHADARWPHGDDCGVVGNNRDQHAHHRWAHPPRQDYGTGAYPAEVTPRPLADGIDFLGYVVRPTHTTVRHRVVAHANAALAAWEDRHVVDGTVTATPEALRNVRSVWSSYEGHFRHANSHRLQAALRRRFPWLDAATRPHRFPLRLEGRAITLPARQRQ